MLKIAFLKSHQDRQGTNELNEALLTTAVHGWGDA